jgi:hypothetical protein
VLTRACTSAQLHGLVRRYRKDLTIYYMYGTYVI